MRLHYLDKNRKNYNYYPCFNECYKNARTLESGGPKNVKSLPEGLPEELSIENLMQIEELTKKYKK